MCDGVEVEVCMHGRQGCLVACVQTEHGSEKGVQTHQTQPDMAPEDRTHRTHRTQSPHFQSEDATPRYLMQDGFLLMPVKHCDLWRAPGSAQGCPTHLPQGTNTGKQSDCSDIN